MLWACGNAPGDETLGIAREAVNACAETVPANRAVDGFPAYAQCATIQDGAIWSNNGIDTAASSQGAGWVRTQNSGGYQCTEFARRYFMFHWGIDYQHGNAGEWCDGTLPSTLTLATSPTHGDLIVFAPGSCGADATTGHVAVVDTVDAAGAKVTIVEQNQASRRSTQQSCAKCFIHAVKNDGSAGSGSGGSSSGGAGAGGSATGGSSSAGTSTGGSAAGGAASSAGASSGGSGLGGTSPSDPGLGTAGSTSGPAPNGGAPSGGTPAAVSGTNAGGSSSATPSPTAPATDDAGCSVGLAASTGRNQLGTALLLVGLGLFARLRRPSRAARPNAQQHRV
ncbi:MAG: CHAP domain-containing protein [Myxococcales bacterium]